MLASRVWVSMVSLYLGGFRTDVSFVDRTTRDWVDLNLSRSFCIALSTYFFFLGLPFPPHSCSCLLLLIRLHVVFPCVPLLLHMYITIASGISCFLFLFSFPWTGPISVFSHIIISILLTIVICPHITSIRANKNSNTRLPPTLATVGGRPVIDPPQASYLNDFPGAEGDEYGQCLSPVSLDACYLT